MGKALVVFDPAHGETRRVAEEIAVGLSRAGRVVTLVTRSDELSPAKVEAVGIVVLGAVASVREAATEGHGLAPVLVAGGIDRKTVSVFDAGPNRSHGAGARALRHALQESDPALHFAAPGISVIVRGSHHDLPEDEVARCRRFGEHLAGLAQAAGSV